MAGSDALWLVMWCIVFLMFVILPACCNDVRRQRTWKRIMLRQWNVPEDDLPNRRTSNSRRLPVEEQHNDNVRQTNDVVSKAEESEIREIFLMQKLSLFSQALKSQDFGEKTESCETIHEEPNDKENVAEAIPKDTNTELHKSEKSQKQTKTNEPADMESQSDITLQLTASVHEGDDGSSHFEHSSLDGMDDSFVEHTDFVGDEECPCIRIPMAGQPSPEYIPDIEHGLKREVPGGCSVCLCTFEIGDRVTWSSNEACNHAFHEDCIVDWLRASGRKGLKRMRRKKNYKPAQGREEIIQEILSVPWLCPNCRQDFIKKEVNEEDDKEIELHSDQSGNTDEQSHDENQIAEEQGPCEQTIVEAIDTNLDNDESTTRRLEEEEQQHAETETPPTSPSETYLPVTLCRDRNASMVANDVL